KTGDTQKANLLKEETILLKERSKELSEQLNEVIDNLNKVLHTIPNVPHESVPSGNSDKDNEEVFRKGEIPELGDDAKPHWELAKDLDIIDFELGNKITGAGFPVYKGKGAKLQRALISYFLDKNIDAGYTEYQLPLMVNEDSGFGTGQLPDKEGQMYHVVADNLYLIPTAEVPATNIYRDSLLKASDPPIALTGYTPCFRREAGSYGSDVRGLNRLHQFDKVEILRIENPERSYNALNEMVEHVKSILNELKLPYRILKLCGGDLGFTSALTYDFEVYSAAQKKWLEISSVSNFETFQANRLKLRFKDEKGKKELCHTLNGSSLALPRVVAAIIENGQENGKITIPEALTSYAGFSTIS
ncbi:MAG: serine--tRNA ligase, partial [Flavobacteriaceae bacterium]|nr:serine--tRNA ligase [Flavobacteriaceae bacterium]